MAGKKKATRTKAWRLAGEALAPAALSVTEEQTIADIFSDFETLARAESAIGIRTTGIRGQDGAVKACLEYFCGRFEGEYKREEVLKALATATAIPMGPVDITPGSSSILSGGALWLLDYVESHNLQSELLALLPEDAFSEIAFPVPYEEFRYPPEALRRTLTAFTRRKKGTAKEFRKLMGLIRKDDAARLRGAFREALSDYFGRFLEVCKRVTPPSLKGLAYSFAPPFPGATNPLAPPPSVADLLSYNRRRTPPPNLREFAERTPDMAFLMKTPGLIGFPPDKMQAELYYRRMTDLLSEFTVSNPYEICAAGLLLEREDDLLMSLNALTCAVLSCAERHLPWAVEYCGETPELYERGEPSDALEYLFHAPADAGENASENGEENADAGEDASDAGENADAGADASDAGENADAGEDASENGENAGAGADASENGEENAGAGDGEDEDDEENADPEGELCSVAQLFHIATGYLLPRDRRVSESLCAWFRGHGLSAEESRGLAMAAMALSSVAEARADADGGLWDGVGNVSGDANAAKAESVSGGKIAKAGSVSGVGKAAKAGKSGTRPPVEEREDAPESGDADRVCALNRQLKAAKQALHEKELEARQLEDQLRDERSRAEQDRMELHGLRETMFRTRSGETLEFDVKETAVRLPYQVRRRILIFGGHDTWSKSIRPLLPGARFFQRESLPDLNAIKGADVVWIQANALSHKFYYRIIETARRENIEVRYFGFASARKCAEQVAEREVELAET